jgi:hypothetical protein
MQAKCVWALADQEVTLDHEKCIWMLVTLWSIWTARRKAIHEENFLSTYEFIRRFRCDLGVIPKYIEKKTKSQEMEVQKRWVPPTEAECGCGQGRTHFNSWVFSLIPRYFSKILIF